jgi:hypothetical protein
LNALPQRFAAAKQTDQRINGFNGVKRSQLMSSMKKMFALLVLASAVAAGCHSKKPATAPPPADKAPEGDATGGAAYGGQKPDAGKSESPDAPKPDK